MEVRLPRLSAVQKKVLEAVPLQSVEYPGQNEGLLITRLLLKRRLFSLTEPGLSLHDRV